MILHPNLYLQNDTKSRNADSDVKEMSSEEKVIKVAKDGKAEIPQLIEEGVISHSDTSLPGLIPPVYTQESGQIQDLVRN